LVEVIEGGGDARGAFIAWRNNDELCVYLQAVWYCEYVEIRLSCERVRPRWTCLLFA
jgi:hypothetical protein